VQKPCTVSTFRPRERAAQPLGMPLHGKDGERPVADGLDRAVLRAGKDLKPRPQPPDGLMVCTVDRAARAVQLAQKARRGVDGMQPVNAVNLTVALDVLTQRAAKIDVEDFRAVQCLTVKARVHVAPAGQQQNVRVLRRFGERRTDQRERIFVIFQAYR